MGGGGGANLANVSAARIYVADLQMLIAAFCFGIGFIGQRAVSVEGLLPLTTNATRFALSSAILTIAMPILPMHLLSGGNGGGGGHGSTSSSTDDIESLLPGENTALTHMSTSSTTSSTSHPSSTTPTSGNNGDPIHGFIHTYICSKHSQIYQLLGLNNPTVAWGVVLGVINFLGSGFQQWGISMTSANKVAFIAGFDLFLTPIFGLFVPSFKKNSKPSVSTWIAVFFSVLGVFYLSNASITEFEMGKGEAISVLSACIWTLHISYTDMATTYVDSLQMMLVQMYVVTALSSIAAFFLEPQVLSMETLWIVLPWIVFLALVEGLGFVLMAAGQSYAPPTHAAILLSLEGVFTSIVSYFILNEILSSSELFGCFLMLLATAIAKFDFNLDCFSRPARTGKGPSDTTRRINIFQRVALWFPKLSKALDSSSSVQN